MCGAYDVERMRVTRKTIYGKTDAKGILHCYFGELEEFCKLHPSRGLIIRAEVQPIEPSERTKNYYFGYCVSEMQGAMLLAGDRLTREQVDLELRKNCPICIEETREEGHWRRRVKEFDELDQAEANEFIEWLYQYAAENYNKILDSPYGESAD